MLDIITAIIAFVIAAALVTLLIIVRVRSARREKNIAELIDLLPYYLVALPRDKDLEADKRIKNVRDRIVLNWMRSASFSPRAIYELAHEVSREVASVYHPDAEDPLQQVSVNAIMELNRRITRRVTKLLELPPFNLLGKVDVGMVMAVKDGADFIKNHPVTKSVMETPVGGMLKKIPFGRLGQAWKIAKKIKTPMGIALEAGKELTFESVKRLFISELIGIVAEEAVTVYSGSFLKTEKAKSEFLILYASSQLLKSLDSPKKENYQKYLEQVASLKNVDNEIRLFLTAMANNNRERIQEFIEEIYPTYIEKMREVIKSRSEELEIWREFAQFKSLKPIKLFRIEKRFSEYISALLLDIDLANASAMAKKAKVLVSEIQ